jgi:DNA ligase-1
MAFKPLLSATYDPTKFQFGLRPWLVSPKLDGIRAVVQGGVVLSRNLKPIPNQHVQKLFGHLEHFDGELIVGDPTAPDCYSATSSGVKRRDGEPDVWFHVFDHLQILVDPFTQRLARLQPGLNSRCTRVYQQQVTTLEELMEFEATCLERGFEGIMLRDASAPYKLGRSTLKEGVLIKVKRMATDEAVVIGMEELMHNGNEATLDALGHTKRSSHAAGKVSGGTMGKLVCEFKEDVNGEVHGIKYSFKGGTVFCIGTGKGLTSALRQKLWDERNGPDSIIGKVVSFNHFPIGYKDAPRLPSLKGERIAEDV